MPRLMSASMPQPMSSIDSVYPHTSSASTSTSFSGISTIDSLLNHLQSCSWCKQELSVAFLRDGHDCCTAAAVVETISALSYYLRVHNFGRLEVTCDDIKENLLGEEVCHSMEGEKSSGDYYRPETISNYAVNVVRHASHVLHDEPLAAPTCEPQLKRQNAFEHISRQGSFESTSAAETEWLMDGDQDESCEDEGNVTIGVWPAPMLDSSSSPIFYLPKRQNAFEIPAGASEEDWSKYIQEPDRN